MNDLSEKTCVSVFAHNTEELTDAFTEIWIQLINERERNESKNVVLQTNVSGL